MGQLARSFLYVFTHHRNIHARLCLTKQKNGYIFITDKGKTTAMWRRKTRGSLNEDSQLPENEEFGTGFFI